MSDTPPSTPARSPLVPILAALVVVMAGAAGFFFWKSQQAGSQKKSDHASAEAPEEHAAPEAGAGGEAAEGGGEHGEGGAPHLPGGVGPTLKLPDFVVHLRNPEADRYARISFEVEVLNEADKLAIAPYMPRIRDAFVTYLSDRTIEELGGSEGLGRTKKELLEKLEELVPGRRIRNLYVSDFVVQ
jgi:flagellar FliL protein